MKRFLILLTFAAFVVTSIFVTASETEKKRAQAIEKAVTFLRSAQGPNGAFSPQMGIGPTAVVIAGLLDAGVKPSDPMVKHGLDYLKQSVREDGGVYTKDGTYQNYETCIALMCFATANKAVKEAEKSDKGPYDQLLANAKKYLIAEQFAEQKGTSRDDRFYGGAGYGRHQRPDLSNTQFFVEALRKGGTPADDPAIQAALVFVSRCQNLESEHNTLPAASKINDGGFYYTAANDDNFAGTTEDGGLRSYASMTYAGLKSMIYAGLKKDDKRVKAAYDWARKHYDLQQNPGLGTQGLFYYYQTVAKALSVMEITELEDIAGKKHRWKEELVDILAAKQQKDGSWINENERWMEGDPNLVTGYILMALADCQ